MSEPRRDELWEAIAAGVAKLDMNEFRLSYGGKKTSRYAQLYPRYVMNDGGGIHYEWLLRGNDRLEVALHFEFPSQQAGERYLALLRPHQDAIRKGIRHPFRLDLDDPKSSQACFVLPYKPDRPAAAAPEALRVMALLVARTWPLLEPGLPRDMSQV